MEAGREGSKITDPGREEFLCLLREVWIAPQRQYFDFDIALFFVEALPREEALASLRGRIAGLEATLAHLEAHHAEQDAQPEVPPIANAIFEHTQVHVQAELAWTRDLLSKVEKGLYP